MRKCGVPEELFERNGTFARRQVQVPDPVGKTFGDPRLAAFGKVRTSEVVVEMDVVDQWGGRGALFEVVEAKEARRHRCVPAVETDPDGGVIHRSHLPGEPGGPGRGGVGSPVHYQWLGIGVFDGYRYTDPTRYLAGPPKSVAFGGELIIEPVTGVARGHPLARVTHYYRCPDPGREPYARLQHVALQAVRIQSIRSRA